MMMSFFLMGLIGVLWVVFGYNLAFDTGFCSPFIGDLGSMWLNGVGGQCGEAPLADGFNISATCFALFQGMVAIISPALISGALVERISIKAWFWFCLIWSLLVDSPMAHMVWGGGFLGAADGLMGAIDFDGSSVVPIASGVAALVTAAILAARSSWPNHKRPPHNVPFILLGAGLLWFGWFGFNGASMFAARTAGYSSLTTTTAASAGMLICGLNAWFQDGKPTAVGAATGAVAGLVGITPAAGFVSMPQSLLIVVLAAVACLLAVRIKTVIRFDDSLDTFMVDGVGGSIGALLTGILVVRDLVPADYVPQAARILEQSGNPGLFINQCKAVLFPYGFVALATAVILYALGAVMPLRVSSEDEDRGLDFVAHGEEAYDPMTN